MNLKAVFAVLALMLLSGVAQTQTPPARLIDFEIPDQFGDLHRHTDVAGDIVLLIGSDKDGSVFNPRWGEAIHAVLGEHTAYARISHLPHADLRGVPFFLRGFVRGKFPQDRDKWVLLDWKGRFAKAYGFTAKQSNVLVFAPDGTLVHQTAGREPDEAKLQGIVDALTQLLEDGKQNP